MITYKKGDLFKDSDNWDVLVHGCNCFNAMGAGIAKIVKMKYPEAYVADRQTVKGSKYKLGNYSKANQFGKIIINAYTQYEWSGRGDKFEYKAFTNIMQSINSYYLGKTIAMPKIGAGLAGGNWNKILKIIQKNSENINVIIYEL